MLLRCVHAWLLPVHTYRECLCWCKVRSNTGSPVCLVPLSGKIPFVIFLSALWNSRDLSQDFLEIGVKFTPCHFLHPIILSTSHNFRIVFWKLPQFHAVLCHHFSDRSLDPLELNRILTCWLNADVYIVVVGECQVAADIDRAAPHVARQAKEGKLSTQRKEKRMLTLPLFDYL